MRVRENLKESGVGWIGKIPQGWDTTKVRFVAQLESGHTPSKSEDIYWENLTIPWVTTSDIHKFRNSDRIYLNQTEYKISELGLENSGAQLLPKGTVFLSRTASVGFSGIMNKQMATSQDFANWVCSDDLVPEYLVFVFRAMDQEFERLMKGSTHQTIYMPEIRSLEMPLPSVDEQKVISDCLIDKVSDIADVVSKKEDFVNKLQERRTAIITSLVTAGLTDDTPLRSVESEWYTAIPEHWKLLRLDHIRDPYTPIVYGIVQPGPDQDDGVPYIKGGQCEPEKLNRDNLSKTTEEIAERYSRSRLDVGDLVYEIRGSVGRVVKVPPELEGANLTQDTARISSQEGVDRDWLMYALRSEPFRQQMELQTRGAAVEGVNLFDLRRGVLPVPPIEEQREIGRNLTMVDEKTDEIIRRVEKSIKLFEERRQALIKNSVTGQIDVTDERGEEQETLV
ncbi:restriction endonuclease subunit S [Halobium salinum]|uniref:Restriction endonuclease subunit S n=1 Tax=Halobium salinum TaxID=1364940 RepID=A0ABD5P797_9EURY|nr:restriction endonuclease subunit S [Halobium salinum]